jgi:hypothetical protein
VGITILAATRTLVGIENFVAILLLTRDHGILTKVHLLPSCSLVESCTLYQINAPIMHPRPQTSSWIPPVDNLGEQADPFRADVEEVEDIITSNKKRQSYEIGQLHP